MQEMEGGATALGRGYLNFTKDKKLPEMLEILETRLKYAKMKNVKYIWGNGWLKKF